MPAGEKEAARGGDVACHEFQGNEIVPLARAVEIQLDQVGVEPRHARSDAARAAFGILIGVKMVAPDNQDRER